MSVSLGFANASSDCHHHENHADAVKNRINSASGQISSRFSSAEGRGVRLWHIRAIGNFGSVVRPDKAFVTPQSGPARGRTGSCPAAHHTITNASLARRPHSLFGR